MGVGPHGGEEVGDVVEAQQCSPGLLGVAPGREGVHRRGLFRVTPDGRAYALSGSRAS